MYDEALGFCTEYFAWYPHIRRQMWDAKEEEIDVGEILIGKEKHKKLTIEELKAIHEYISLWTPQPLRLHAGILNSIFYINPL